MLWGDDFNGTTLDTSNWTVSTGPRRDAVNTASAVSVSGGNLAITTYTGGGTHYTGFIGTSSTMRATYGYWEASIKYNDSPGMWSAFWMQSPTMSNPLGNPAAAGTEIDISEHRAVDSAGANISNKSQTNIHWDGYGSNHQSVGSGNVGLSSGTSLQGNYHLYGLQWTPTGYTTYIDGTQVYSTTTAVSQRSEFIYLSSEVEDGIWAGNIPTAGYGTAATSTTKMLVDYVRVWQKPVSASADLTLTEDTASAASRVTITQRDNVSTSFTATSSNTNLIPVANVSLGGSGANRTATITPATDQTGVATVTLTASNSAVSGNDAFTVTVNAGSATNLGFENDLSIWNEYGGAVAANYNQHSGSRALRIVNSGGAEQVVTGLAPNTTYTLSAWGRNSVSSGSEGYLGVKSYGGSQLLTSFTTTSLALKTLSFTTGATNTTATIFAYKPSTSNESFFDDFTLFRSPTLTAVSSQTIFRNFATASLAFTVGRVSSDTSTWSVTATSSNTTLVPNANLILAGTGTAKSIAVTPAANQTGTATITLTVTDSFGGSDTSTFMVKVLAPPTITSTVINGGDPQRSRVNSITLNFATATATSSLAMANVITLTRSGSVTVTTGSTGAKGRVTISPATGSVTSVVLSFDNANTAAITAGVENRSLSDGIWTLSVAGVTVNTTIRRLYGDLNNDGTVNGADLVIFGNVFSTANIAYDFNNDGTVNGADLTQFGNNFGKSL
ncbi:hypothetical protein BH11PLA2_BH11PLA2_29630 [soil metagenome]